MTQEDYYNYLYNQYHIDDQVVDFVTDNILIPLSDKYNLLFCPASKDHIYFYFAYKIKDNNIYGFQIIDDYDSVYLNKQMSYLNFSLQDKKIFRELCSFMKRKITRFDTSNHSSKFDFYNPNFFNSPFFDVI